MTDYFRKCGKVNKGRHLKRKEQYGNKEFFQRDEGGSWRVQQARVGGHRGRSGNLYNLGGYMILLNIATAVFFALLGAFVCYVTVTDKHNREICSLVRTRREAITKRIELEEKIFVLERKLMEAKEEHYLTD